MPSLLCGNISTSQDADDADDGVHFDDDIATFLYCLSKSVEGLFINSNMIFHLSPHLSRVLLLKKN